MKTILAVVVLYRLALEQSSTWLALDAAMKRDGNLANALDLFVADNSPSACEPPEGFSGVYVHDSENLGLAPRYNQALAQAAANGAEWLLLFDQDTKPTDAYFAELLKLSEQLRASPEIAVIVPKLRMNGRILSPHAPVYRRSNYRVHAGSSGVVGRDLRAFNSGALVRVSALNAIGGFPTRYWLDYLDHATFHRIQAAGGQIYVMDAVLEHELSDATPNRPVNPVRLLNRLRAEEQFYAEYGSASEMLRHRIDLVRQVVGWARRGQFDQANLRWKALLRRD